MILPPTTQVQNKAVFPGETLTWPPDGKEKVIKLIHWAGGNIPNKMNYRIHFKPEVTKYIDNLIK